MLANIGFGASELVLVCVAPKTLPLPNIGFGVSELEEDGAAAEMLPNDACGFDALFCAVFAGVVLAPNWNGEAVAAALLLVFPNVIDVEPDPRVPLFWPKPPNAVGCEVPNVDTLLLLLLLPNGLPGAVVFESLFAAAPRKLKAFEAGGCDGCDCCDPKGELLAGVAPKAVEVLPKFKSGCALKAGILPLLLFMLLPPKPEAGGKDELGVEVPNGFGADGCGKLLVELLPKANVPALGAFCCCGCPNPKPPPAFCCGCGAVGANGFAGAALALGSGPKSNALAEGGLGLKEERPYA